MSFYPINLQAEFQMYVRQNTEEATPVTQLEDALLQSMQMTPSEDNPNLFIGNMELKMPLSLQSGMVADWPGRAKDTLKTLFGQIMEIQEIEILSTQVVVDQEALFQMAEQIAADLHKAWQAENREIYQVRRKQTNDSDWIEERLEGAEIIRLTAEQAEDFDPDKLQLETGSGQAVIVEDHQGERLGVYVDIMNSEYGDLPGDWQEANRVSAQGAAQLIADSILENGSWDMEEVAEKIHQQWLEANPWAADGEQGRPFSELSPEDQERDRSVARVVSRYL